MPRLLLALLLLGCSRAPHQVPAACSVDAPAQDRAHELRCAVHYYARACSLGLHEGCRALASLAQRYPDPEIERLAKRYAR